MNFKRTLAAITVALTITGTGITAAQAATPHNVSITTNISKTNIVKTTSGLNLRAQNTTKSKVLLVIPKNATLTVTNTKSGWAEVTYKNKKGWVSQNYLKKQNTAPNKPTVVQNQIQTTAYKLNLRKSASTKSGILKTIPQNTILKVSSKKSGWVEVTYQKSKGWISSDYVKNYTGKNVIKPTVSGTIDSSTRTEIINTAKKHLGVQYRWGGTSPRTGWDCSGFVQYVFKQADIGLPRVKAWVGHDKVSINQAKPGDLVVQRNGGHVGIYAGNGKMYHAANPKTDTALGSVHYSPPTFYNVLD